VGSYGSCADERGQRRHRRPIRPIPMRRCSWRIFLLSLRDRGAGKILLTAAGERYGFKKWRPEHGLTTDQYEKELAAGTNYEFDYAGI